MKRTGEEWAKVARECGALWEHSGDPTDPHVELTSGMHADAYLHAGIFMESPRRLRKACAALLKKARGSPHFEALESVEYVFGPALGGITLAYQVAALLGCNAGFCEKTDSGLAPARFGHCTQRTKVLLVEDTTTTGGSIAKLEQSLREAGFQVQPLVLVLFNWHSLAHVEGVPIVSLLGQNELPTMHTWTAQECPLCKAGSSTLRPPKAYWRELMKR